MPTLFVLRHAKSSWDDPLLEDYERPLAPRGKQAVKLLAAYARANEIDPALILCSSARRTRDTLAGVLPSHAAQIEHQLYGASCEQVLVRLRAVPEGTASTMVVGHNPAMQMLVLKLLRGLDDGLSHDGTPIGDIERKFPTGALATLRFGCQWSELAPGCAALESYIRPKALA